MIIDIHAHTTNSILRNFHTNSATLEELEAHAETYGIDKIVLMATYFPFKKSGLKNELLLKRIEGRERFLVFGSLDVMNNYEAGLKELEDLVDQEMIAGIKLYPGYQDFSPSDPKIFDIYRLADHFNIPVMFHGGELYGCCRPHQRTDGQKLRCGLESCRLFELSHLSQPKSMVGAIENFPRVKFVVSHMANPYFEELRAVMALYRNVFTDISGQFVSGADEDTEDYRLRIVEEIKQFLDLPGSTQRLMFGTDFPIQSYKDSLDLISRLQLFHDIKEQVMYKNAQFVLDRNAEVG